MAKPTEIASEINALAVHCRPPIMDVEQRATWLRDWCNDLADLDIEAIRSACREWRQSGAVKFPTPGQFLPLVRRRGQHDDRPKALASWRPLSDAEYEALTLADKIRHRLILAKQARDEAVRAAMREGWDRNLAHAPAAYREFNATAESHEAEAQRLRRWLRDRPLVAAE